MKNRPFILGITGGSGSGKTTLINNIRKDFSRKDICIISQDDYYYPREKQEKDENGITNFDLPGAIDKKTFYKDLTRLIKGKPIKKLEYTFNNEKATPQMLTFYPAPIIIVEGLFIFHYKKINKLFDLKVYVHAKENIKLVRRIIRDQNQRNYPLSDVLYRYQHHVLPSFEKYIKPYEQTADLIINNNVHFKAGAAVLEGFLKQKLAK